MQTNGLLFLGLLAALTNLAGGALILPSRALRENQRALKFLVALGAGFLLAVNFIEILPRTLVIWLNNNRAAHLEDVLVAPFLLLLAGYLLVHFFEQTLTPHIHFAENKTAVLEPSVAYTAVGAMLFHAFFDGIAIAVATAVNFSAGMLVFLGIALHKLPEGFTVASLVLASGQTKERAILTSALVGLTTFAGVVAFALLGNWTIIAVPYLFPIAAGVALYVAASELIPELHHHGGKSWAFSVCVFAGVALFFVLHYFLHGLLEG